MERFLINYKKKGTDTITKPDTTNKENIEEEIEEYTSDKEDSTLYKEEEEEEKEEKEEEDKEEEEKEEEEEEEEEGPPEKKKRKVYKQKYTEKWEHLNLKWLTQKNKQAYCKVCLLYLKGGITHINRHGQSAGHKKKCSAAQNNIKIDAVFKTDKEKTIEKSTKIAETKLSAFLVEHNLPIRLMDHLTPLLQSIFPDSRIAQRITGGRTKYTGIILNVLKSESFDRIVSDMKSNPFSLIIDETTDVSTAKSLAIVSRYCKNDAIVNDTFFALIEVQSATAEGITTAVINILNTHKIPLTNFIGFASDNAYVMMGSINGVQAKLKEINPNIFTLGCTCHSFHLCSSKAAEELPKTVEEFVRDICNYFSNSPKRIQDFEHFQSFTETVSHKILKLSSTRWLSFESVVNRILEQWEPLKLYFISESTQTGTLHKAEAVRDALHNPVFHIYLLFLSYILKIVNDMNKEFQSEKPKIYTLGRKLKELYKTILKSFIKRTVIDKISLDKIDPRKPENFVALEEIYIGAKAANKILNSTITDQDLMNFRRKVLSFYIKLCLEIKNRFQFDSEVINFIGNFDPNKIKKGDSVKSIGQAEVYFPSLVEDIEALDREWRSIEDNEFIKNIQTDKFWPELISLKNDLDEPMFPNLKKVINGILALPHSSAAAERVFSQLTLIKTKNRNRLYISTCDALISSKELLKNNSCYKWNPSDSVINRNWKNSAINDNDIEEMTDDIIFEHV